MEITQLLGNKMNQTEREINNSKVLVEYTKLLNDLAIVKRIKKKL